jgi:hypothetical protein
VARGLLNGIARCGGCGDTMTVELVRGLRRYVCGCTRAVPADELDVIVLGRLYDRRRSTGATGPARLCEESQLVDRFLTDVTVGRDWTRPTVRWADAPTSTARAGRT